MSKQITRAAWARIRRLGNQLANLPITPDQIYKGFNAQLDRERRERRKK